MRRPLTEASVRALQGSERYETYWDITPGFGVRVGKRSKTYIVMRGRNRERITIGRVGEISLADARSEAKRVLAANSQAKPTAPTFKTARDEFVEQHYCGKAAYTKYQVKLVLTKHCQLLESMSLPCIDDTQIKLILDKLCDRPSAQLHAYRYLRTFFTWSSRPPRRYIKRSPMEGYLPPGADRRGTRILSDAELKAIWNACDTPRKAIFRLMILWGSRNTETCLLEREWVNGDLLTIPGRVTKNGRDHGIPILPLARAVLCQAGGNSQHFIAGRFGAGHLAPSSIDKMKMEVMKASGTADWQNRDLRRTFRSNMARLSVPRDVCEVLINHAPPVLDDIYDRYDRMAEKREALRKYERFIRQLLVDLPGGFIS